MSKLLTLNGTVITRNGNILLAPEGSGLQNKTVTPTESTQSVTYDDGYEGLGTVTVNPISSTYVGSEIPTNPTPTASGATVTIPTGYYSSQTTKSVSTATQATPTISVSSGGLITASATQTAGYVSSGTKSATEQLTAKSAQTYTPTTSNQTISSGQYLTGNQVISGDANLVASNIKNGVSIFGVTGSYSGGGGSAVLDSLEVTPSESVQQFDPEDYDIDGWDYVEVGAISSTYIGSGITVDPTPTASGDTVTIPTGYYSEDTTKSISSGSATTPATTITANPSISVDSSTGVITATTSTTQSVTPTVSAGYVSSGTAGTITVSGSNTSNLTTQSAQTIYPSTSDQTISSGTYLTGTQTIKAVTTTNLSATNIKDGVTVEVGDSSDSDRVATVIGTFTDSSTVSSGQTAAGASQILDGYSAWVDGSEVQGSHKDQSSKSYTVSASGSQTISPDSTYDAMEEVALTVPAGSATGPSSLSGSSATVSTGTNTLTLTKTGVSTTPTVSAGYVSSATSSTATVALTASVTTKGATTYHPSTSDQIISSGTYITGTQTFKAVTTSNLTAANIKKDVVVKVGDLSDDDCVISVTGTYEGSGGGSVTLNKYAIRPDAELLHTWSDDFLVVSGKGVTIPAYTTSSTTLITGGTALSPNFVAANDSYRYFIVMRHLTIPSYNVTTKAAGRQEYTAMSSIYELVNYDANIFSALVSTTKYGSRNVSMQAAGNGFVRCVYWSSGSAIKLYTANTYGCAQTINTAPAVSSGTGASPTLTLYTPNVTIRGSSTYLSSTYWSAMTDIRCQYVYEMYRVPKNTDSTYGMSGWTQYNNMLQLLTCAQSSTHKLS